MKREDENRRAKTKITNSVGDQGRVESKEIRGTEKRKEILGSTKKRLGEQKKSKATGGESI